MENEVETTSMLCRMGLRTYYEDRSGNSRRGTEGGSFVDLLLLSFESKCPCFGTLI